MTILPQRLALAKLARHTIMYSTVASRTIGRKILQWRWSGWGQGPGGRARGFGANLVAMSLLPHVLCHAEEGILGVHILATRLQRRLA
jgi:hypothetical protein